MTVSERETFQQQAAAFGKFNRNHLEAALLMQRSPHGAEIIARVVREDLDVATIARLARRASSGDVSSTVEFNSLDQSALSSMCRVLCLTGESKALNSALDILRAQKSVLIKSKTRPIYRNLFPEALIFSGHYEEAAEFVLHANLDEQLNKRLTLGFGNPFREHHAYTLSENAWLGLLNDYMSPSGQLIPIYFNDEIDGLPFDKLWSTVHYSVSGPLVTVVMSAYKSDRSIFGAINSILNQTWQSFELLVIDDASGSEYDDLFDEIEAMDDRIRVIRLATNGGTYLARNRALTLSRGEFITFQDSDDWSHPERIERQVRALLSDKDLIATQSSCFRTDDYLDPVQVSYPQQLRRNESSLMFRTEIIRRIGFFHFTRKGGDSEYRLRMEAAFNRATPIIGEEPLAIVRLTPGSLSRNEFSPGFRHPRRLIYSQGFSLIHDRAAEDNDFYRPLREYRDSFVPGKFQPRISAAVDEPVDVVLVADLRTVARLEDWIVAAANHFSGKGLKVGLAQATGLLHLDRRVDRMAPEISALLTDGVAVPVDFGERRKANIVIIADPSLLQAKPWGSAGWTVDRVYICRPSDDRLNESCYDESTVEFNCLQIMNSRPTWLNHIGDLTTLAPYQLFSGSGYACSELTAETSYLEHSQELSERQNWVPTARLWCSVNIESIADDPCDLTRIILTKSGVPQRVVLDETTSDWCAVVGWPLLGYKCKATEDDLTQRLLAAWQNNSDDLDEILSDIGGHCIALLGSRDRIYVYATNNDLRVSSEGNRLVIDCSKEDDSVGKAKNELEISIASRSVEYIDADSKLPESNDVLGEYAQLISWEIEQISSHFSKLVLDDDFASAIWLGLFRDYIDDLELTVRASGSRVARFLDAELLDYSVGADAGGRLSAAHCRSSFQDSRRGGEIISPSLWLLGRSTRARNLAKAIASMSDTRNLLDRLWLGLADVAVYSSDNSPALNSKLPELKKLDNSKLLASSKVSRVHFSPSWTEGTFHLYDAQPDLSRGELFPMRGYVLPRRGAPIAVVLVEDAQRMSNDLDAWCERFDEHSVIVALDSTAEYFPEAGRGLFAGSEGDDLLASWAQQVRLIAERLNSSSVVIQGMGNASSLAGLRLGGLIGDASVVIERAVVDEPTVGVSELPSSSLDEAADRFSESVLERISLRGVLEDSPDTVSVNLIDSNELLFSSSLNQTDSSESGSRTPSMLLERLEQKSNYQEH